MAKHRPLLRATEKRDGGSLVHKRPGHPRAEGFPNKKCASRELPGEHLVVLRSTIPDDASDEEAIAGVKRDFERFGPIIRAIEKTVRPQA